MPSISRRQKAARLMDGVGRYSWTGYYFFLTRALKWVTPLSQATLYRALDPRHWALLNDRLAPKDSR